MFASEEREVRQATRVEAAQQISLSRTEAVSAPEHAAVEVEAQDDLTWGRAEIEDADALDEELAAGDEVLEAEDAAEVAVAGDAARQPELVPVSASVFDDDFFRSSRAAREAEMNAAAMQAPAAGVGEVRLYAGASATHGEPTETDELDIPAFLRRGH